MSSDAETARSPDLTSRAPGTYVLITYGVAWGVLVLHLLGSRGVTRALGEIGARHPLLILAVYAPAIAAAARTGPRVAGGWVALTQSTDDRDPRVGRGVGWWRQTWLTARWPDRHRERRCV